MRYLDLLEEKVLLERLVIGLEEPVLIKGLGELSAKIDSGNGGYNVIHGTDFHQQGSELMFTTQDSQGNEKRLQSTVIDTIEVNMGGGNIETRPVIELDIKFAGEDYKKIPFSVSDRSTNTNPILISKGFVEKELEALIDVGKKNISNNGIEVVYGEAFEKTSKSLSNIGSTLKNRWNDTINKGKSLASKETWKNAGKKLIDKSHNVADNVISKGADILNTPVSEIGKKLAKGTVAAGKAAGEAGSSLAKGIWGGLKTLGKGIAQGDKWLKGGDNVSLLDPIKGAASITKDVVSGAVGAVAALGGRAVLKKIGQTAKSISHNTEMISSDKKEIQGRMGSTAIPQKLLKVEDADLESTFIPNWSQTDLKSLPIIAVTSFMCNKGEKTNNVISGLEQKRNQWRKLIEKAKLAIPEVRTNKDKNVTQSNVQNNQPEEQEETLFEYLSTLENGLILEDAAQTLGQQEPQQNTQEVQPNDMSPQEIEEVQTYFENLNNFSLWFVSIKNESEEINKELQEVTNKLNPLAQHYKELIDKNQPLAFGEDNKKLYDELREKKKTLEEKLKISSTSVSKSAVEKVRNVIQKSDAILSKLFSIGEVHPDTVKPIISNLANEVLKQGGAGFFVMAYSPDIETNKREFYFFEDLNTIAFNKKTKQEVENEVEEVTNEEQSSDSQESSYNETETSETPENTETPETPSKEETPQVKTEQPKEIRVKSRAQRQKQGRINKKAHMNNGKKKGTESEEEPWVTQEEEPWIKEKLSFFKSKGII